MGRLEISVKYRGYVKLSDTSGNYVSWCPLLDIKSQGRTADEARASLDDSVKLFVVHCFRRGILEETLKRRGLAQEPDDHVVANESDEHVSVTVQAAEESIDSWEGFVPLNLIMAEQSKRAGVGAWQQ